MNTLLEALLELNAQLMVNGYKSDFNIEMGDRDFEKFVYDFEIHYKHLITYPDLDFTKTLKELKSVKIAGPGSYFLIKRKPNV